MRAASSIFASLTVENFPVIVVIDKDGNNLYETAIKDYCRMEENA